MLNEIENKNVLDDNTDYIEALKQMKQNTVSKDEYEALKQKNKELLQSLVDGNSQFKESEQPKKPVDIEAKRKELFTDFGRKTDLENAKNILELRNAILDQKGIDVFLPTHEGKFKLTEYDIKRSQEIADYIQSAIDYADGDSSLFIQELNRNMTDSAPRKASKVKR